MPNWKKVILSGSNAPLNHITASGNISGSALSTLQGFGSITASNFGNKDSSYTGSFRGSVELTDTLIIGNSITFEGNTADDHELTLNLAAEPTSDVTISIPDATDTLVGRGTTDTLENKSIDLDDNTITGTTALFNTALSDGDFTTLLGTETLKNKTLDGDTSTDSKYAVTLQKGGLRIVNPTTNNWAIISSSEFVSERIQTLPDAAGTFVIDSATQTLTNKTLTNPTIGQITGLNDSITLTGDVTASMISGSHTSTSSFGLTTGVTGSFDYVTAPNILTEVESGSISLRLTTEEANIDSLQSDSGSFSTRITLATSSIASATASIASLTTRIGTEEINVDNLQTDSGSFSTRITNDSGSFSTRVTNLKTDSGSFSTRVTDVKTRITTEEANVDALQSDSGSFSTRITRATSSIQSATASISLLKTDSGSFSTRITTEATNIDNLQTDSGSFSTRITTDSGSFSTRVTNLKTDSGSFSTRTQTLETTMTAEQSNIDDLESKVGQSLNTSDSPTFAGMTISGNISASGDITAQNYIVRSTVTTITSSFSSGSTIFGDDQQDTHRFTGSIDITGSFSIVGDGIISGSKISASNIVGTNLIQDSSSFSTRITTEATNIDNLQTDSGSFSTRITTESSNIDNLQTDSGSFSTRITDATASIQSISQSLQSRIDSTEAGAVTGVTAGTGRSGGGTSGTVTINVDFSDDDFQSAVSGSWKGFITGSNIVSSSVFSSPAQGAARLVNNGVTQNIDLGLETGDAPTFNRLTITDRITTTSVTASGDISASGTIFASKFESAGDSGETISFNDNLSITGNISTTGNITSITNITASGHISSSGTSTASFGRFEGDGRGLTNVAASTIEYGNITNAPSSSFSQRLTIAESSGSKSGSISSRFTTLEGRQLGQGTGIMGGGNIGRSDLTLEINFADTAFQTAISGSLGSNGAVIRTLNRAGISGSFTPASSSFSTRVTNATSSINAISTSFSSKVTTLESRVNQEVKTDSSPTFAGLTIDGDLLAQRYIVSSSVTHITSSFSSGSTIFGDTIDDTHKFTGSLFISGSDNKITGSLSVSGSLIGKTLVIGGGVFTSQSLASGGTGIFSTVDADTSNTLRSLQISGSVNISSSLTVKPTDSGSTSIHTNNINAGYPTANRWQDNLDGSYFNNFDHNTNVSEILRFMAGIISHSIDTASPTPNTKTFSSIDTNDNNLGTTDSISGYIPQNYTDIDDADTVKTLKYLITKGWASVGSTIFNGISVYHDNGNSYAIDFDSNSGGSTGIRSSADNELFGLGGLTNGGATQFDVKVIATQSFSDNSSVTAPTTASSTFSTSGSQVFSATSFGTTDGVTLAKIDSANPAVIPSSFQDGKFADVGGTDMSGTLTRKYHASKTSFTGDILSVSSSGYYRFHDLKVGIATGSGNFDFKSGTTKNFFYAPVDQIESDIGTNSHSANLVDVATNIDYTNMVSRSLSGAPYLTGSNYQVRYNVFRLFKPMYASSTTLTRLNVSSVGVGTMEVSGDTLSTNGGTIQTSGLVFQSDGTTAVNSGVPRYDDRVRVTASLLKKNLSGATNIEKGGFGDTSFNISVMGRNRDGTESAISNLNTINYHVAGTFGQTAASGSLGIYGRSQGYDIDSLTGTTANFVGETYRARLTNSLTSGNADLWGASWEGATFKLNSLGDYDLQVKPGYLVDPGGNYGYWYPNSYGSGTYKYYVRYFRHSGTTKTSMTVNVGKTLVNWNSTSNGIAVGIIFTSGTSAGTPSVSTCRIFDISDLTSNLIESGVSQDYHKNPFTSDIDLYGNTGGSLSSTTYTIPLRNSDSMILDSNNLNLYVIVRYKGDPTPITGITLSYS